MNTKQSDTPVQDTYRVMEIRRHGPDTSVIKTVKKHADSMELLSADYPLSDGYSLDELSQKQSDDGFVVTYVFEQFINGDWQKIRDSRTPLTPGTANL